MGVTYTALAHGHGDKLFEWADIDNTDSDPNHIAIPPFTEMSVQIMEVVSGTPTVGVEWSLNNDADSTKVWQRANDPSHTVIALTTAGAGETILESGILMRPRVVSGTGAARVRIKASPIR